jgi:hypothetical protein
MRARIIDNLTFTLAIASWVFCDISCNERTYALTVAAITTRQERINTVRIRLGSLKSLSFSLLVELRSGSLNAKPDKNPTLPGPKHMKSVTTIIQRVKKDRKIIARTSAPTR